MAAVRDDLRSGGSFTADTVAARAGCSPATFYSHFGTKDDALTAAFEQTLADLVDGSTRQLTVERFEREGVTPTVLAFVEWQATFFRLESLVFRTALSRLPDHQPLRAAYRSAEQHTLDHLSAVFAELQQAGSVNRADESAALAEAFMIASQGINNPRALRPAATPVRAALAAGISGMLTAEGDMS